MALDTKAEGSLAGADERSALVAGADDAAGATELWRLTLCGRRIVLNAPEQRAWFTLCWTAGLSTLLRNAPPFLDIAFLGYLGTAELGASSLAGVWISVSSMWIWTGQEEVISTLTSQAYGHGNYRLAGAWLQMAILAAACLCVPVCVSWMFSGPILVGLGFGSLGSALTNQAEVFMRWYALSLLPLCVFSAISAWLNAIGVTTPVVVVSAVGVPLSAAFNYVLIYGMGDSWRGLGFIGSPISSALVSASVLLLLLLWVRLRGLARQTWPGLLPRDLLCSRKNLLEFVAQAVPNYVGGILEILQLQIMSSLAAHLGEVQLATHNAIMSLFMIVTCFMFGAVRATSVRVGHALGARRVALAREVAAVGSVVVAGVSVIVAAAVCGLRERLCVLFSSDPAVAAASAPIFLPLGGGLVFLSLMYAAIGVLLGMGKPGLLAVAVVIGNYGVAVPLGFVFTRVLNLGLPGLWYALLCGYAVVTLIAVGMVLRADWDQAAEEAVARSKAAEAAAGGEEEGADGTRQQQQQRLLEEKEPLTHTLSLPQLVAAAP